MNKRSNIIIRLVVGSALFLIVLSRVDLQGLTGHLSGLHLPWMAPALATLLANRLLVYYRLKRLLDAGNNAIPYRNVVKLYWMFDFGSLFVPGTVGADILKVLGLRRYLKDTNRAAAAIFLEQFLGICSLALIAFASLLAFGSDELHRLFFRAFLAVVIACLAAGILLIFFPDRVRQALTALLPRGRLSSWMIRLVDAVLVFSGFRTLLLSLLGLCLVIQGTRIAMVYFVALALALDLAFLHVAMLFPLVMLAVTIPVSLGGFGVREAAFVILFAMVGVPATDAFALSLLSSLLSVLLKLPGGLIFIREGLPGRHHCAGSSMDNTP